MDKNTSNISNESTHEAGSLHNEPGIGNQHHSNPLPYDDPAVLNPDELASFPKQAPKDNYNHHHAEHHDHLVNRRTPVREGRNITRTENNPGKHGFM